MKGEQNLLVYISLFKAASNCTLEQPRHIYLYPIRAALALVLGWSSVCPFLSAFSWGHLQGELGVLHPHLIPKGDFITAPPHRGRFLQALKCSISIKVAGFGFLVSYPSCISALRSPKGFFCCIFPSEHPRFNFPAWRCPGFVFPPPSLNVSSVRGDARSPRSALLTDGSSLSNFLQSPDVASPNPP